MRPFRRRVTRGLQVAALLAGAGVAVSLVFDAMGAARLRHLLTLLPEVPPGGSVVWTRVPANDCALLAGRYLIAPLRPQVAAIALPPDLTVEPIAGSCSALTRHAHADIRLSRAAP